MTKFGFKQEDNCAWMMSKRMFRETNIPDRDIRPLEGDLLFISPSGSRENYKNPSFAASLWEINFVKHESPFWPLGKYFVFQLETSRYIISYEKFDTTSKDLSPGFFTHITDQEVSLGINRALEEKKEEILSFTEDNPFGNF